MGVEGQTNQETTFVLRSPEALLYYLGQLSRMEKPLDDRLARTALVCVQGRFQPLFVALPESSCEGEILSVDAGKGRFLIPAGSSAKSDCKNGTLEITGEKVCQAGRSMQALRLLGQLMALQKSAKDLPATATVRVVGQ